MVESLFSKPLFRTKLYRPPVTEDYVPRPRLLQQLDQILQKPIFLLSAPPGYGKSTLLSAWLEANPCLNAWIALDDGDNDLATFLAYFLAAIRSIFPMAMDESLGLLKAVSMPPLPVLSKTLIYEIEQIDKDFILVLDDYHVITNPAIQTLLSNLLHHPQRCLHLALASRYDPPLSLINLRAHNQIAEIRTQDLRFTLAEATAFIQQTLGSNLDSSAIAILEEKTEGWPTGLRLAALSLRYSRDLNQSLVDLQGNNRFIMEYLLSQVIDRLPASIQEFLFKTSILDQFCADLCEAVVGGEEPVASSQVTLDWLEYTELFIIPLNDRHQWYRYHHLFQSFLRDRLTHKSSEAEIRDLNLRASAWYARHQMIDEALNHAMSAGDSQQAVMLVCEHRYAILEEENLRRLALWLKLFNSQTIRRSPDLLILQAWFAFTFRFDSAEVLAYLDLAEQLLGGSELSPQRNRQLRGEIAALRAGQVYQLADGENTLALTQSALENNDIYWVRSFAWLHRAFAYQMIGRLPEAYAAFRSGQAEERARHDMAFTRVFTGSCFVHWMVGDLDAMLKTASQSLALAQSGTLSYSTGWAHFFMASAYYHHNELMKAEFHARTVFDLRYQNHILSFTHSTIILALVYRAQGRTEQALGVIKDAQDYLTEIGAETLLLLLQVFQAELALFEGRLSDAVQGVKQVRSDRPFRAMVLFFAPEFILPKVLLAQNTPSSLEQAEEILSRLHTFVINIHNTRFLIEVLALQALLYQAQGDEEAALTRLEQALALAQPGGFIRIFTDYGMSMAALLRHLHRRGIMPGYLDRILEAFPTHFQFPPSVPMQGLISPLSGREMEILNLLEQRLSNKEIAQRLFISPITVKRHTINIYQKLQVNSRREAVLKASELGILIMS